ncbi:unnamed protein product [Cuscuta epithymum]|uniref:Uncharacterized protein n=1 Tax=Cuscuta epithymum TaxID=186058 RepID=A0AAV0EUU9_9ASTE|nr:unnamed protein product [Cuscuta epithymum]
MFCTMIALNELLTRLGKSLSPLIPNFFQTRLAGLNLSNKTQREEIPASGISSTISPVGVVVRVHENLPPATANAASTSEGMGKVCVFQHDAELATMSKFHIKIMLLRRRSIAN